MIITAEKNKEISEKLAEIVANGCRVSIDTTRDTATLHFDSKEAQEALAQLRKAIYHEIVKGAQAGIKWRNDGTGLGDADHLPDGVVMHDGVYRSPIKGAKRRS